MEQSIGKSISRVDGILKVTGKAIYTADQPVPGLAHAVLVVSSIAKGRIVALDTSDAERVSVGDAGSVERRRGALC